MTGRRTPMLRHPSVTDVARAAAWRRAGAKLRQLAARRSFLADLVVISTERSIDRLLEEEPPEAAIVDTRGEW